MVANRRTGLGVRNQMVFNSGVVVVGQKIWWSKDEARRTRTGRGEAAVAGVPEVTVHGLGAISRI